MIPVLVIIAAFLFLRGAQRHDVPVKKVRTISKDAKVLPLFHSPTPQGGNPQPEPGIIAVKPGQEFGPPPYIPPTDMPGEQLPPYRPGQEFGPPPPMWDNSDGFIMGGQDFGPAQGDTTI